MSIRGYDAVFILLFFNVLFIAPGWSALVRLDRRYLRRQECAGTDIHNESPLFQQEKFYPNPITLSPLGNKYSINLNELNPKNEFGMKSLYSHYLLHPSMQFFWGTNNIPPQLQNPYILPQLSIDSASIKQQDKSTNSAHNFGQSRVMLLDSLPYNVGGVQDHSYNSTNPSSKSVSDLTSLTIPNQIYDGQARPNFCCRIPIKHCCYRYCVSNECAQYGGRQAVINGELVKVAASCPSTIPCEYSIYMTSIQRPTEKEIIV